MRMDMGEIRKKILEDKENVTISYRRYPVRFLFMEMSNDTQEEIEELVKSADGELLELSDYIMKKDDGWMTRNRFIQAIKENASKTKDTYVVGFSELIRFFSNKEIESTVLSLFDIENSNIRDTKCAHRKIYFICFSMKSNVYQVLQKSFTRKDLIDPFINADYEFSGVYREIYFVSNDYADRITKNKITTSEDWIGLWRHSKLLDFSYPIWCCSESLYKWYGKASPDNAFQIDEIRNAKDYLQKAFGVTIEFPYLQEEVQYWNQLNTIYPRYNSGRDLQQFADRMLDINAKSTSALSGKWLITDNPFEKWFIRQYVKSYLQNTFLDKALAMVKTDSKKEFLTIIWQQGYWIQDTILLEERIEIINTLNKYADFFAPEKEIGDVILEGIAKELCMTMAEINEIGEFRLEELCEKTGRDLSDLRNRLYAYYIRNFKPAFIGLSSTEKEFVINLYTNEVIDKAEIKEIYPSFYSYLYGQAESLIEEKENLKSYLQAYRESKVADADNLYLESYYLNGGASSEKFYTMYCALPNQEKEVEPYFDKADIYILDGIGAEYLPLMVDIIRRNGYEIEYCNYAACHLPSTTEINKTYLSVVPYKEWFRDFDTKVIHGEIYCTSVNLRKAFDMLESKLKEIVQDAAGKRIVITADHGATARARWTDTKKKYDISKADHEGRCYRMTDGDVYQNTDDYIVFEDMERPGTSYVLALNETSLYNKAKYENHGGATIEEILVPVIVAVPQTNVEEVSYKVIAKKLEVRGYDRKVSFAIIPSLEEEVFVIEADKSRHTLKRENGVYSADLLSSKEQDITVEVVKTKYKFRTISIAKKNMMGDDGFDD